VRREKEEKENFMKGISKLAKEKEGQKARIK
jgi:hypothetical protein